MTAAALAVSILLADAPFSVPLIAIIQLIIILESVSKPSEIIIEPEIAGHTAFFSLGLVDS